MKLSARNTLKGKVTEVKLGQIVGEVVLDIGGQKITSVITRDAIEEMGVKVGDEISAVIKSTEIMLLKS
jgi:molybdopterin-binding protein